MKNSIKVGDLVMNKFGDLGMITSIVKHPSTAGYDSGYIEWLPQTTKMNYSLLKIKEFRQNFEFYVEMEKRRAAEIKK